MPDRDASLEPLSRNRDFKVLLSTQGISSLGDAVSFTALPLLVLALTGSGLAMGVVGALQTLPDLVFGMVAGALADRNDRKRMMFLADLGRAALTALIPLSVYLGGPTMAVILVVAAPMSVLRSFFLAGYTASVPALVGRPLMARANSYFEAVYSLGYIVGPAIAGLLATTIGPGATLAIDAASFALSALGLLFVRRELRAPVDRPRQRLRTDIREGIDYIVGQPVLRAAILFWGATSIINAPLVTALAVHITRDLGETASVLGVVLAAYGIGTVTGALVISRRGGRRPVSPMLFGGNVLFGTSPAARLDRRIDPGPGARRDRGGDRPVDGARDVRHAPGRLQPGRAPGPDRQHGPHDLARPATGRTARGRGAHRPDQRLDDDRPDGHRDPARLPGLRTGGRAATRDAPARARLTDGVRRPRPAARRRPGR